MKTINLQQALAVTGGTLTKNDLNEINNTVTVAMGMIVGMAVFPTIAGVVIGKAPITRMYFAIAAVTQIAGAALGGYVALSYFTTQPTAIDPVEAS